MGGYQEIFGGSAVYPSNQTYSAITLAADTNLSWPIESVSSETIVADLMDVTPQNQNGWQLVLPDATGGSNGITMIVNNVDNTYSFIVSDSAFNQVASILPGTVWLIYLVDNSTQAGVWRAFQYGAQAGSVNVAAIAGSGLLAIGSSLNQSMPVVAKSTNYTVVDGDRARVILWTGAAGTLTLPSPAGVANNWFVNVVNAGSGALSVTPTSGLIDGSSSKSFTAGTGNAIVFTDGNNYYTLGYGSGASGSGGFDYTTLNCAGSDGVNGPIVLAGGQLDRISYKCFGILTGNRTIVVPGSVQQYWIDNETTSAGGPWTLTVKTNPQVGGQTVSQPGQAILYCDGSAVQPAVSGITLPLAIGSGGTGGTSAATARTNLGSSTIGDSLFTVPNADTAQSLIGGTATGKALFTAANVNAALNVLAGGTMTGNLTISGVFTAASLVISGMVQAGGFNTVSATVPANGMYYLGANRLGFSSNTTLAGYFDAAQNLILTNPLPTGSGGTGATTKANIATNIGDAANTANVLVSRNASGYIFGTIFNMSFAADNLAVSHVMYQSGGDGYLRRMTLANFNSVISPDQLSTASGSAPSFSARAWARLNSAGTLLAGANINTAGRSALGTYFITFITAMADTNYLVVATCRHVTSNFIMAASEADSTQITKTISQCGVYVGVPDASADAEVSIVIYR